MKRFSYSSFDSSPQKLSKRDSTITSSKSGQLAKPFSIDDKAEELRSTRFDIIIEEIQSGKSCKSLPSKFIKELKDCSNFGYAVADSYKSEKKKNEKLESENQELRQQIDELEKNKENQPAETSSIAKKPSSSNLEFVNPAIRKELPIRRIQTTNSIPTQTCDIGINAPNELQLELDKCKADLEKHKKHLNEASEALLIVANENKDLMENQKKIKVELKSIKLQFEKAQKSADDKSLQLKVFENHEYFERMRFNPVGKKKSELLNRIIDLEAEKINAVNCANECDEAKIEIEKAFQAYQEKYAKDVSDLEEEIQASKIQFAEIKAKSIKLEKENATFKIDLDAAKNQAQIASEKDFQLEKYCEEISTLNQKIDDLEKSLEEKEEDKSFAIRHNIEMEEKLIGVQSNFESLQEKHDAVMKDLEAVNEKMSKLQKSNQKFEQENIILKADLHETKDQVIAEYDRAEQIQKKLDKTMDEFKIKEAEIQSELKTCKGDFEAAKNEAEDNSKRAKKAMKNLDDAKLQHQRIQSKNADAIDNLNAKIHRLEEANFKLDIQLKDMEIHRTKATAKFEEAEAAKIKVERELHQLQQNYKNMIHDYSEKFNTAKMEIASLRKNIETIEAEKITLKNENEAEESKKITEFDRANAAVKKAESLLLDKNYLLQLRSSEADKAEGIQKNYDEMKNENDRLQGMLQKQTNEFESRENEKSQNVKKLNEANKVINDLKAAKQKLEQDYSTLQREMLEKLKAAEDKVQESKNRRIESLVKQNQILINRENPIIKDLEKALKEKTDELEQFKMEQISQLENMDTSNISNSISSAAAATSAVAVFPESEIPTWSVNKELCELIRSRCKRKMGIFIEKYYNKLYSSTDFMLSEKELPEEKEIEAKMVLKFLWNSEDILQFAFETLSTNYLEKRRMQDRQKFYDKCNIKRFAAVTSNEEKFYFRLKYTQECVKFIPYSDESMTDKLNSSSIIEDDDKNKYYVPTIYKKSKYILIFERTNRTLIKMMHPSVKHIEIIHQKDGSKKSKE